MLLRLEASEVLYALLRFVAEMSFVFGIDTGRWIAGGVIMLFGSGA
jgi:hypothetical protein